MCVEKVLTVRVWLKTILVNGVFDAGFGKELS